MSVAKTHMKPVHIRRSAGENIAYCFIILVLILLSVICIYPLYQVLVCSVSDPDVVLKKNSLIFWPEGFHLNAYKVVLQNRNIRSGFLNTFKYLILGTFLQYTITTLAAYPLSLRDAKLKRPLMIFMTVTMYFSGGLIPYFLLVNQLGLVNTIWVLTVPGAINVWNCIIMRTQFLSIPSSLKEAAVIDGAGDLTMLFRIMLPLSKAVTAVLILFTAVGYWNMWFDPMIYMTDRSSYPIQTILREILIDSNDQVFSGAGQMGGSQILNDDLESAKMLTKYANIIVCTVPILCVYPFAQKYFVKGVMIGSLKG